MLSEMLGREVARDRVPGDDHATLRVKVFQHLSAGEVRKRPFEKLAVLLLSRLARPRPHPEPALRRWRIPRTLPPEEALEKDDLSLLGWHE